MALRPALIEKLAEVLVKCLQSQDFMRFKANTNEVRSKLRDIIAKNFAEEEEIEKEAREILASHAMDTRALDQHRMFLLIKQRIARQRGFVL
jgi:hypothetical protein